MRISRSGVNVASVIFNLSLSEYVSYVLTEASVC